MRGHPDDPLSFLGGDMDEGEDENDLLREDGSSPTLKPGIPGSAAAAARIIEGGVTTHILKLTPKVPRFAGLMHCARDCADGHRHRPCRVTNAEPYENATVPRTRAYQRVEEDPLEASTAGSVGSGGGPDDAGAPGERRAVRSCRASCGVTSCLVPSSPCCREEGGIFHILRGQEENADCGGGAGPICTFFPAPSPPLSSLFPCASRLWSSFSLCSPATLPPPAGYHLVDGFLGAAGEQDPIDPALFPPLFSRGAAAFAAWAASALRIGRPLPMLAAGQWRSFSGPAASGGTALLQAGANGFPMCLPEFAEDARWGWWRDAATTLPLHESKPYVGSLFKPPNDAPTVVGRLAGSTGGRRLDDRDALSGAHVGRDVAVCVRPANTGLRESQIYNATICYHEADETEPPESLSSGNRERHYSSAEEDDCVSAVRVIPLRRASGSKGFLEKDEWVRALGASSVDGGSTKAVRSSSKSTQDLGSEESTRSEPGVDSGSVPCRECGVRAFSQVCSAIVRKGLLLPVLPSPVVEGQRILLRVLEADTELYRAHSEDGHDGDQAQLESAGPAWHLGREVWNCSGKPASADATAGHCGVALACCCAAAELPASLLAVSAHRFTASLSSMLLTRVAAARAEGLSVRVAFDLYLKSVTGGPSSDARCGQRGQPTRFSPNVSTGARVSAGWGEGPASARKRSADAAVSETAREFLSGLQKAASEGRLRSGLEPRLEGAGEFRTRTFTTCRDSGFLSDEASPVAARKKDRSDQGNVPSEAAESCLRGDVSEQVEETGGAALCAVFQLAVSVLTELRLVVLIPAAADWHMVSAKEAAGRYCVPRLNVLTDHLSKLCCVPSQDESMRGPVSAEGSGPSGVFDYGKDDEEAGSARLQTSPETSPATDRALSDGRSIRLLPHERDGGVDNEICRPYLPVCDPTGAEEAPLGVPAVIWAVWGHGNEAVPTTRRPEKVNPPHRKWRPSAKETERDRDGQKAKDEAVSPGEADKSGPPILPSSSDKADGLPKGLPAAGIDRSTVWVPPCVYRVAQSFIAGVRLEQRSRESSFGEELCLTKQGVGGTMLGSKGQLLLSSAAARRTLPFASLQSSGQELAGTQSQVAGHDDTGAEHPSEAVWALRKSMRPIVAWLRLDGSLNSALVQVLSLRCWSVLQTKPGSGAREVSCVGRGMRDRAMRGSRQVQSVEPRRRKHIDCDTVGRCPSVLPRLQQSTLESWPCGYRSRTLLPGLHAWRERGTAE